MIQGRVSQKFHVSQVRGLLEAGTMKKLLLTAGRGAPDFPSDATYHWAAHHGSLSDYADQLFVAAASASA